MVCSEAENPAGREILEIKSCHLAPCSATSFGAVELRPKPHPGSRPQRYSGCRRSARPAASAANTPSIPAPSRTTASPPSAAIATRSSDAAHRPADTAGALRGEIERKTDAEEAVERTDDAQILRADRVHGRVVAEQRQPGLRIQRRRDADRSGERRRRSQRRSRRRASARSFWPAPILVPTIEATGAPSPNTSGTSRYSSRTAVP